MELHTQSSRATGAAPQRLRPPRRWPAAACLLGAAAAGLALAPGWGTAGPVGAASAGAEAEEAASPLRGAAFDIPAEYVAAIEAAWQKVDGLAALVESRGLVPRFGQRAQEIVEFTVAEVSASGPAAKSLEQVLDAPLQVLFRRQLQTLLMRSADRYEAEVARRPNPLEAARAAEQAFVSSAAELVRPGSGWSFEAERRDLMGLVRASYGRDAQLVEEQVKQGRGKQITIEVIRKLQQQQAAVQRQVETRGAFPWNVKWQYMVENSPLGFRGQYTQGRSVVELLLMPSPDPRYKKNLLNRIGPLNLAVAFDMLL